jgi:Anti-sigma-K factor rskA/Putative zinc-finger
MSGGRGERDCGADAAAYVLRALDPAEAEVFRNHLATCSVCQDEVAAFAGVIDALHLVAPDLRAPAGLRVRVMRAIRAERKPGAANAGGQPPGRLAPGRRRAVFVAGLALVLAAAVFGIAEGLWGGGRASNLIRASVLGSAGSAEVRVTGGHAELLLRGFPPPPAGDVYEVWLKQAGRPPIPTAALFSVTSDGAGDVGVPGSLSGVRELLVTPEPDGGSLVPTHAPVVVAHLS